ncbi:MAG: putative transport system permease protein [Acidobacteriota bacterium]|jgi:predicted permease|nr:putative transport system permease protein [Acidobacteriota bacterium]
MRNFFRDLLYGVRMLRKSPGFTLVAVLTLALGVGANTAIFQLIDAVRLRTLPVKDPQELVGVQLADTKGARGSFTSDYPLVTNPIWEQVRDWQEAFNGIFAWGPDTLNLSRGGEARFARAMWVSGDFFKVLDVRPELGRVLNADDDRKGCGSPVAVVSHAFWQREFGGDPSVVGRSLALEGRPFEVVGVTPASFYGLEVGRSFDVAAPLCAETLLGGENSMLASGTAWWLTVVGRLKPGWTEERAAAHLASISPGVFEASLPTNYPPDSIKTYRESKLTTFAAGSGVSELRETYETPLWLLLAVAGTVLLIACANLANLLLARATAREREIATRLALGASRWRLVRQLLTESMLLAVCGAALGALLAQYMSEVLVSLLSKEGNPLFVNLQMDWRVLAFSAAAALLTCALFGLAPALRATRVGPGAAMKAAGRGLTASRERFGLRRALIVSQVALSLVLVAGALLFSRSLSKLATQDAGLRREGVLVTTISFSRLKLPVERRLDFKRELLERLRAVPGVEAAADANILPLSGSGWNNTVWLDGSDPNQTQSTFFSRVSPDYFKTLNITLLSGRDFNSGDAPNAPKVAIVNESFARSLTGGENPVGKRFRVERTPSEPETVYEIVGLVRDAKYRDLREEFVPVAFTASSQAARPSGGAQFLIRSSTISPAALAPSIKSAIVEVSPDIDIVFRVFKDEVDSSLLRERLMATLSGAFGLLALVLACVGLYGVMSYGVAGRTNEIGIRMALGARGRDVLWLILREAALLVLVGVGLGLPAALAAARLATGLLYGVTPADPVSVSLAVLLLFAVAALACYIPARRATKVDPMVALRYE